jgi:hypothetical protein
MNQQVEQVGQANKAISLVEYVSVQGWLVQTAPVIDSVRCAGSHPPTQVSADSSGPLQVQAEQPVAQGSWCRCTATHSHSLSCNQVLRQVLCYMNLFHSTAY